jgi:hypothetical protein
MRVFLYIFLAFNIIYPVMAQSDIDISAPPDFAVASIFLPRVEFISDNYYLLKAFYPDYGEDEPGAEQDIINIERKAAPLIALWDGLGDTTLMVIRTLSGIEWVESGLKVHLMKFLPVTGLYEPLAIPIEGIKTEPPIVAAPSGWSQFFLLIQLLCGRNLLQTEYPGYRQRSLNEHFLMQKGPYRFDILTMTLAIACADKIIPPDSLKTILRSSWWQEYNPGWEIYRNYFQNRWYLSSEKPLTAYLATETFDSSLAEITTPPKPKNIDSGDIAGSPGQPVLSGGGRLGFYVAKGRDGFLQVAAIDSAKLAFACGLRAGDKIISIDGESIGTARILMDKILSKIDDSGVYLVVKRNGETKDLILHPVRKE